MAAHLTMRASNNPFLLMLGLNVFFSWLLGGHFVMGGRGTIDNMEFKDEIFESSSTLDSS